MTAYANDAEAQAALAKREILVTTVHRAAAEVETAKAHLQRAKDALAKFDQEHKQ